MYYHGIIRNQSQKVNNMQQQNIITQDNSNNLVHTTVVGIRSQHIQQSNRHVLNNVSFSDLLAGQNCQVSQIFSMGDYCQFCFKYRQQRRGFQKRIVRLEEVLADKNIIIQGLQEHLRQLKDQSEYLMQAIQALRDRNQYGNQSQISCSSDRFMKIKQDEVSFANRQIAKLKQWLKQEKIQVLRSIECIKLKDTIIQNLQKQLSQLKQSKPNKKPTKLQSSIVTSQTQSQTFKTRQKQLQSRIIELVEQITKLQNENISIKQQLSVYHLQYLQQQQVEPSTPILKLKQFSKNSNYTQSSMDEDYKVVNFTKANPCCSFLSRKCLSLEDQIEKMMIKMQKLKEVKR